MEKNKKYKGIWKSFFVMLHKSKLPYMTMILAFAANAINSYITLRIPDLISSLMTDVSEEKMITIFLLGTASIIFILLGMFLKYYAQIKIDRNMQYLAVDKIMYLKMDDIEKSDPREIVSRVTTDTKKLSELLMTLAVEEIPRLYFMIGALMRIYKNYDTTLGNVLMVSIPVTIIGSWLVGKITFGKAEAAQAAISRLTARIGEKINNMAVIKSYGSQKKEAESGEQAIKNLEINLKRKAVIDRLGAAATTLVTLIPTVAVIAIGASFVLSGRVETAIFVAYYSLAVTFIGYVAAHMTLWILVKNAQGATYRLSKILEASDETVETVHKGRTGTIEFHDVSKSFGDNLVLDHVSFKLEAGKKTALVGHSGCGKSTVLNLIEQFYYPDSGTITMDSVPVAEWDINSYRNSFTYVPQNAPGFSGSIRELINYGKKEKAGDDEIWSALKKVDAVDFVELLGGLDYEVGNNAEKLSGGQKQKLSMARALIHPQSIMLLDEATSALDVKASVKVQNSLDEAMKGNTMILVAHNIHTVINADKIIVFRDGHVAGEGTHKQLMKNCEFYRELASSSERG